MKMGLLPLVTFVRNALAMLIGQLTAKQRRKRISKIFIGVNIDARL